MWGVDVRIIEWIIRKAVQNASSMLAYVKHTAENNEIRTNHELSTLMQRRMGNLFLDNLLEHVHDVIRNATISIHLDLLESNDKLRPSGSNAFHQSCLEYSLVSLGARAFF